MRPQHIFLFALCGIALLWSWVNNPDTFIWALEASPGILACIILLGTYKKFQFTTLAYFFVLLHCIVLFIGAKYTYGEVPLFNWLRDTYALERNNYDKVGHFAQGFFPALLVRELIIRLNLVNGRNWTKFFVVSVCLAASACYELIEWLVSVLVSDEGSVDAFLGTQGYIWDTQSDMLFALVGATVMVLFFSKIHDKALHALSASQQRP